jgi:hypothetical protein
MPIPIRPLLFVVALLPSFAVAATTIEYDFTTEQTTTGRPPVLGHPHVTSTIDGPKFRNVSRLANAVELSEDDGKTTYFGALHSTPQTPLARPADDLTAPIVGRIEDEKLVIGESTPGPTLFGIPTRVYTVDYTYTIAARVVYVFNSKSISHARFTFTVADIDVSSAALRVAFSRGYGYALSQRAEAFTGLPLIIEGTIESPGSVAHVHIEAASLQR